MIANDLELQTTLDRIAWIQKQVVHLRKVETNPLAYRLSASGFESPEPENQEGVTLRRHAFFRAQTSGTNDVVQCFWQLTARAGHENPPTIPQRLG